MKTLIKKIAIVSLSLSLFGMLTQAHSSDMPDVIKMKSGSHGCSGNHGTRLGGTENQTTVWNFRNFNADRTVNINSVRIYAANGVVIFDAPAIDSFPGNFKTVMAPHQSTQLRSGQIFSSGLPGSQRPIQLVADWVISDGEKGLAPRVGRVRLARSALGGEERSRHGGSGCKLLRYHK